MIVMHGGGKEGSCWGAFIASRNRPSLFPLSAGSRNKFSIPNFLIGARNHFFSIFYQFFIILFRHLASSIGGLWHRKTRSYVAMLHRARVFLRRGSPLELELR
jgi:hypothetical protein